MKWAFKLSQGRRNDWTRPSMAVSTSSHLCSWMYSRGLLSRWRNLSTILFFPTPCNWTKRDFGLEVKPTRGIFYQDLSPQSCTVSAVTNGNQTSKHTHLLRQGFKEILLNKHTSSKLFCKRRYMDYFPSCILFFSGLQVQSRNSGHRRWRGKCESDGPPRQAPSGMALGAGG